MDRLTSAGIWDAPIVTRVEPLPVFYPAEAYHDDYFQRNGTQPYCQIVVAPKVAKFRKGFAHRLRSG
jgi:peptide-methionine (S)-S-oxide reductase